MARNNRLRQLAVAATFLFHHSQHALALPQAGITVSAAPPAWVTVDPSGVASTVTPAVITTEGQRATVLEPPASLLSTATYTLSPNGHASTYTGLAPVASATGANDAGVFLACTTNQGIDEPFCLPKSGSTLHPGHTYYSTSPLPGSHPSYTHMTNPPGKTSNLVPLVLLPAHPPRRTPSLLPLNQHRLHLRAHPRQHRFLRLDHPSRLPLLLPHQPLPHHLPPLLRRPLHPLHPKRPPQPHGTNSVHHYRARINRPRTRW